MNDEWLALRLQLEWGADEALADSPVDRLETRHSPAAVEGLAIAPAPGAVARAVATAAGCRDLDALREAVDGFDLCPLRATSGHLVFADGAEDARLMVIVEAPGSEDDATGIPLSGRPGVMFDAMLGSIGLSRASVRIGCLVPWRPPGGRAPTPVEIAMCRPFLLAHLELLPAVSHLLMLGSTVARHLVGAEGALRQLRGRWFDLPGQTRPVTALVMAPLDQIAADARQKAAAWADLVRLRRVLDDACRSRVGEG